MPTYVQIKAELDTDPLVLGYSGMTDGEAANAMNDLANGGTVDVQRISGGDLQSVVDATEWSALTTNKLLQWLTLISAEGGLQINTETKAQVVDIWSAGTTRTNLAALQTKPGTRAEVLWGAGTVVTLFDVHVARRQP